MTIRFKNTIVAPNPNPDFDNYDYDEVFGPTVEQATPAEPARPETQRERFERLSREQQAWIAKHKSQAATASVAGQGEAAGSTGANAWHPIALKALSRAMKKEKYYRGVPVDPAWKANPQDFLLHIGAPSNYYQAVELIDPSKPFDAHNVKWMTREEKLDLHGEKIAIYNGKSVSLRQLSKYSGVHISTLRARWESGKRGPDLWSTDHLNGKYYIPDPSGGHLSLQRMSEVSGIHVNTLRARMKAGLKGDALLAPLHQGRRRGEDK